MLRNENSCGVGDDNGHPLIKKENNFVCRFGIQASVASARGEERKSLCPGCEECVMIFSACFLTLKEVLEGGQGSTHDFW